MSKSVQTNGERRRRKHTSHTTYLFVVRIGWCLCVILLITLDEEIPWKVWPGLKIVNTDRVRERRRMRNKYERENGTTDILNNSVNKKNTKQNKSKWASEIGWCLGCVCVLFCAIYFKWKGGSAKVKPYILYNHVVIACIRSISFHFILFHFDREHSFARSLPLLVPPITHNTQYNTHDSISLRLYAVTLGAYTLFWLVMKLSEFFLVNEREWDRDRNGGRKGKGEGEGKRRGRKFVSGEGRGKAHCDNKHIHFNNIAHAPIGTIDMSMNYMYIYSDKEYGMHTVVCVCVCACATSGSYYCYYYIYTRPNLPLYCTCVQFSCNAI